MSAISFGKINKSLLFILLMSISMVFNQYLYGFTYIECFYKMNIYQLLYNAIINKTKNDFPLHRLCDPFFSYIGVILLSLFIPNQKEKIKEEDNSEAINEESNDELKHTHSIFQHNPLQPLRLIHNGEMNYLKKRGAIIIFILILILWIIEEDLVLIYVDIFQDLDFWFFELIIISLIFSKYFSFEIYLHQKLAMAFSIGVCSILKIVNIIITFSGQKDKIYSQYPSTIVFIVLYFLIITARSYVNTQIKVFMDLKFISHRTLLMYYGITGAIICLIVGVSISFSSCSNNIIIRTYVCKVKYESKIYYDNIYAYFESYKNYLVRLIIIVLGMASFFFNKFFTTLIIKSYSPIHVTFSFPIQFFIEKIFMLIFTALFYELELFKTEKQIKKFLLDVFGDIASILGFLIFLEIIELNFCKLNYNLKKNIISRGENDYKISIELDGKLEDSNEDSTDP